MCTRLHRTADHIFTCLDRPQIPCDNNFVGRQIRPAVVLRKASQSNRNDRGVRAQAMMMSIDRSLRLRGHDPPQTIADAVHTAKPDNSHRCRIQVLQMR